MAKIYFIRHGQSEGNVDEKMYLVKKDFQIELTKLGHQQANDAGKRLKDMKLGNDIQVFLSPYMRTRQTFENINKHIKISKEKIFENPLLREQEYKIFKDMEESHMKRTERKDFGPFWYRFKNAEATADVFSRVQNFYNYLLLSKLNGNLDEHVIIVAHEVVIRMFLMILDNIKIEDIEDVPVKNCDIIERTI